jgi:uncharacterized protein DUF6212
LAIPKEIDNPEAMGSDAIGPPDGKMTNPIHPSAFRVRVFMHAVEISSNFSGGPSLLVSSSLAQMNAASSDFGLDTIFVTIKGVEAYFYRDIKTSRAGDFVETFQLPSDLLAIVATPDDAPQLYALWVERGLEPPPLIAVKHAVEAIGPILARASVELAAVTTRCAELQRGLVATRREFEETREAMHGLMRTLSHRYATGMNLVAVTAPSPGKTVKLEVPGTLSHIYPVATESITCLALHVAETRLDPDAVMTVVLRGAESGRVLGEWRVPGKAVTVGWNVFDLPMPVAAVRETTAVEVSLKAAPGGAVSFSLADAAAAGTDPLLAIRIWTAEPGGRFPHARHWVWNALGQVRLPAGTASLVGGATTPRGLIEAFGETGDGSPAAYRLRGGSSLLHLPELALRDAEGISVELGSRQGDLRGARFELVAQSAHMGFASGWRSFAFPNRTLRLGLSLPAALPDIADLYLRIEDRDRAPDEAVAIELRKIEVVSGERTSLDLGWNTVRVDPETLPSSAGHRAAPRFGRLKAHNFTETDKFALFEVTLGDLEFDGRLERAVRFKPSMANGKLSLEFRQGPNWPEIFRDWPGRHQDRFGDVFRVSHTDDGIAIFGELTTGCDCELLAALCRLMPTIVATGVQMLPDAVGRFQTWLDVAREFSAAAQRTFGEPA